MPKSRRARNPILRPWHGLRRWLKGIERHSATRRGGAWARATESALVLALPVAVVLAFALAEAGVRVGADPIARVRLGRMDVGGPLVGQSLALEAQRAPWGTPIPIGEVLVERRTTRHGWPFAGKQEVSAPIPVIFPTLAPDEGADLDDPAAVARLEKLAGIDLEGAWEATAVALEADPRRQEVAAALRSGAVSVTRSWPATIALCAVLWILVFVVSAGGIRVARFTTWLARGARRRRVVSRLRNGECPDCRYDLRAERFPKRCPECGRRIWA